MLANDLEESTRELQRASATSAPPVVDNQNTTGMCSDGLQETCVTRFRRPWGRVLDNGPLIADFNTFAPLHASAR